MAPWQDPRRAASDINSWMAARWKEVQDTAEKGRSQLDVAKRNAIQAGNLLVNEAERRAIAATTRLPGPAQKLGKSAINHEVKRARGLLSIAQDPQSAQSKKFLHDTKEEALATAHGAGDAFTFGAADHVSAGVRAALGSRGDVKQLSALYRKNMDAERAHDQYEQANYRDARLVGQVGGTLAQMVVASPLEAVALARAGAMATKAVPALGKAAKLFRGQYGVRSAGATRMLPIEHVALGGVGGATGAATQAADDLAHGRVSSLGDYTAAVVGGAGQALMAKHMGPTSIGVLGGGVTSMLADEINGRPISFENALLAGAAGGLGGALAGRGAVGWADSLSNLNGRRGQYTKGRLGDDLSVLRSWARLDPPTSLRKTAINQPGDPRSFRDHGTRRNEVEAKYGLEQDLTPNQVIAHQALGDRSRRDFFIPRDIANIAGIPVAQVFSGIADLDDYEFVDWPVRAPLPLPLGR